MREYIHIICFVEEKGAIKSHEKRLCHFKSEASVIFSLGFCDIFCWLGKGSWLLSPWHLPASNPLFLLKSVALLFMSLHFHAKDETVFKAFSEYNFKMIPSGFFGA